MNTSESEKYLKIPVKVSEPDPSQMLDVQSLPILRDGKPQEYDRYSGENSIPFRTYQEVVRYTPTPGELEQRAILNFADYWVDSQRSNPYDKEAPEPDRPKATLFFLGGGDSTALANTGQAAFIRDAEASLRSKGKNKWDIANFVAMSHPSGAPRSERIVDQTDMKMSAKIIFQGIQEAIRVGNMKPQENIILMGASAGGAVAIELAVLMKEAGMNLQQLILVEPAAISEQPKIMKNFMTSGMRAALHRTKEQKLGIVDTAKAIREEILVSMTQPEGAPPSLRSLIRTLLAPGNKKYANLADIYQVNHSVKASGLNPTPLMHDTTKESREKLTIPVILIESRNSLVVNPWTGRGDISDEDLIKEKFPNSANRNFIVDPGYDHSGLGRRPEVWEEILGTAQQIPFSDSV